MNLRKLGSICRQFRIKNNITVNEIARLCYYSKWNIYKFEQGHIDSVSILFAYLYLGLQIDEETICRVLTNY